MMQTISELQAKRQALLAKAMELNDRTLTREREFSAAEQEEYNALVAQVDALAERIEAERPPDSPGMRELRARRQERLDEARKLNDRTLRAARDFTPPEARQWRLLMAEVDVLNDDMAALEAGGPSPFALAISRNRQWAELVAVHESGHALIHLLEGRGISTVGMDLSSAGVITGGFTGQRVGDPDLRSHVAGVAAERILLGSGELRGSDLNRARQRFAERNTGADAWRLEEAVQAVEHRLRPEWRAIRALADRLLEAGQLEGAEAEEILKRHLTPDGSREVSRMAGRTAWRATS